jgi:hypothetical protein
VALVQQVGELLFLEGAELGKQFLDVLVRGIAMGNVLDLFRIAGHLVFLDPPVFGFPRVVGNEERCAADAGVVFTLAVVLRLDGDVIGFAFDDDEGGVVVGLVLRGAPEDKICAGGSRTPAGQIHLFRNLIKGKPILVDQHEQVFLAHRLFWRFYQPFAAHMAPDFSFFLISFNLKWYGHSFSI